MTSKLVERAIDLATRAHEGQYRKYGKNIPYIKHPCDVVMCLVQHIASRLVIEPEEYAAAWLHDVVEDCDPKFTEELRQNFPEKVVSIVLELTNPSIGSKENRETRKRIDREHIKNASVEARRIKLCDRICNLRDMKSAPQGFAFKYIGESKLLLEALSDTDWLLEAVLHKEIQKLEDYLLEG